MHVNATVPIGFKKAQSLLHDGFQNCSRCDIYPFRTYPTPLAQPQHVREPDKPRGVFDLALAGSGESSPKI